MEWIVPLITLVLLEVVLGLDNVIFISIVAARLPVHQQKKARMLSYTCYVPAPGAACFNIIYTSAAGQPVYCFFNRHFREGPDTYFGRFIPDL